jgi:hypothetical protein
MVLDRANRKTMSRTSVFAHVRALTFLHALVLVKASARMCTSTRCAGGWGALYGAVSAPVVESSGKRCMATPATFGCQGV